jgi:hypothetical protein
VTLMSGPPSPELARELDCAHESVRRDRHGARRRVGAVRVVSLHCAPRPAPDARTGVMAGTCIGVKPDSDLHAVFWGFALRCPARLSPLRAQPRTFRKRSHGEETPSNLRDGFQNEEAVAIALRGDGDVV